MFMLEIILMKKFELFISLFEPLFVLNRLHPHLLLSHPILQTWLLFSFTFSEAFMLFPPHLREVSPNHSP